MKFAFALLVLTALMSSCSEYNKVLKADDYTRKFTVANDLYDNKHWAKSIALYEQVYQRMPKSGEGELSYYRIGKAYYAAEDYYMAGYYFGSFFDKYPYSTKTEEAFFLKALCSVKNSPSSSLDQQETELALNDVQQFIYLFPNSSRVDTCNQIMDRLREKLELKEFDNIRLYAKTMHYKSAVVSAETFLADYPTSKYKEEVLYIHIKNSYLLSKNSVEEKKKERIEKSIETYRTFVAQFPESKYRRELDDLHDDLQHQLVTVINSK
ncbi:MAG: outer membrane protein assembly factor BamD [Bacteroidota bacterium]